MVEREKMNNIKCPIYNEQVKNGKCLRKKRKTITKKLDKQAFCKFYYLSIDGCLFGIEHFLSHFLVDMSNYQLFNKSFLSQFSYLLI